MLRRQASASRASLANDQRRGIPDVSPEPRDRSTTIRGTVQTGARSGLRERLVHLSKNRLIRQNAILFTGGLIAGIGGFVFHAIAGRILGPAIYGQVAFLIAL